MKIDKIMLYEVERNAYLPNVEHVVAAMTNLEAEEDGAILRFKNGDLIFSNGKMGKYLYEGKHVYLRIIGHGIPLKVKVINASIDDFTRKSSLELQVIIDFTAHLI